ncbi:MAG: transporter [Deltaproteobacteria bacterium]|nr:transporter [Deltaproteobacteria bacterium]
MNTGNIHTRLPAFLATLVIILLLGGQALAVDDGPRAYWKAREGTNGISVQYLNLDLQTSDSEQFAPGSYIYANSDIEASIFLVNYVRYMTLFNRPSSLSLALAGGEIDVDVDANIVASQFLPPGILPSSSFTQSSSGFADPSTQLVVNLYGTPPLKANFDLIDYEPTWNFDVAVMLGVPIGEYDDDKLVNLGLNRWFGRIAFPVTYNFGVFTPGYMMSLELIPSVWFFADNDDFMGQELKNDPMWQIEAHLTKDFTPSFFGSLDLLYRGGSQAKIDGVEVGDELDIGDLGLTLGYQVTDNLAIRTSFSSNLFGDSDVDNSMLRLQFVYSWHKDMENIKKLQQGH